VWTGADGDGPWRTVSEAILGMPPASKAGATRATVNNRLTSGNAWLPGWAAEELPTDLAV